MNFFRKKPKPLILERKLMIYESNHQIHKDNWFEVFSACLGKMMVVQNACTELVVKDQNWNVDFTKGIIAFGDNTYPIEFIGSESTSANTWLWGWEHINGIDKQLLNLALETKQKGEEWMLEPLTTAEFEITDIFNGHNVAIVTCGLSTRNLCYYRGPHENGAILVAFSNLPDAVFASVDSLKFVKTAVQCIQQFEIDHKIFMESFLQWNGTPFEWNENQIIAHFDKDLCILFEQSNEGLRIGSFKAV